MNEYVFNILLTLIMAVVTAVARYLIPYVRTKLQNSKYAWAVEIVESVVYAIEQTHGAALGYDKKQMATGTIRKLLSASGLYLSDDQISILIESVVGVMNADREAEHDTDYRSEGEI